MGGRNLVADLWGGWADDARTRLWQRDSIAMPYSVSKPFVALCALLLVDRGSLDLDTPVQRYWPGFAAPASVRHVLSHQAGIVALDAPAPTEAFYDWDRMCALLRRSRPNGNREPRTASRRSSSAIWSASSSGAWTAGRRDGSCARRSAGGWGWTSPSGSNRPSRRGRSTSRDWTTRSGEANEEGHPELYQRAVANPPGAQDGAVVNSAAWRAAEIPAVNGHGTARGVAGLYAALMRGELLSPALLGEAIAPQCSGPDRVFGFDNAWGLGFAVDDDGYGMGGLGGSVGWASVAGGYAYAFVAGSMGDHDRSDAVENALRSCLGLRPLED